MEEEMARQFALRAEHKGQHQTGKKRCCSNLNTSSKGKKKTGSNGKAVVVEEGHEPPISQQPSLVTGAKLKPYQLEGLQWMVSLDQNGISALWPLKVMMRNAQSPKCTLDWVFAILSYFMRIFGSDTCFSSATDSCPPG